MKFPALLAGVGAIIILTLAPATLAGATGQTQTIIFPATVVNEDFNGSKTNVHRLVSHTMPNGEYHVTLKVTTSGEFDPDNQNAILIIAGPNHSTQQATFTEVSQSASFQETKPHTIKVEQGEVIVAVALQGGKKEFTGAVEVTMTPVGQTPPAQPAQPTQPANNQKDPKTLATTTTPTNTQSAQTPTAEGDLPKTGAGSVLGAFVATSGVGYAAHHVVSRKKR